MSDDEGLSNALRESLLQPALAELPSELAEELEACLAIWGDEDAHLFVYEPPITAPATPPNSKTSRFVLSTKIQSLHEQLKINILIALPSDYPTTSPPLLQLQDRYLASHPVSDKLFSSILRIYMHKRIDGRSTFPDAGGVEFIPGEVCLYEGVEEVKRLCEEFIVESGKVSQQLKLIREGVEGYRIGAGESLDHLEDVVVPPTRQANEFRQVDFDEGPCPTIVSSEPILDRRSVFIGHCAAISSPNEVQIVLRTLLLDKRIQKASHNISAYRVVTPDGVMHQDNDDDGESAAGGRLAHLLILMEVEGVVVVVSRWFGGVQLGADRFKHINQAARDALLKGGFLQEVVKASKKSKK